MIEIPHACPFCRAPLTVRVLTPAYSERWCEPCQRAINPLQALTTATHRLGDWQGLLRWLQTTMSPELAVELDRYVDGHRGTAGERDPVTLVLDQGTARRVEVAWAAWGRSRAYDAAESAAIVAAAVEIVAEHQQRRR
jgi:hypothetical protein